MGCPKVAHNLYISFIAHRFMLPMNNVNNIRPLLENFVRSKFLKGFSLIYLFGLGFGPRCIIKCNLFYAFWKYISIQYLGNAEIL